MKHLGRGGRSRLFAGMKLAGVSVVVAALIAGCAGAAAPSESAAPTPSGPQELRVALSALPTLNVMGTTGAAYGSTITVATQLFDTLVVATDDGEYVPSLATEWVTEGDTWTFTLRDDAVFHDGTPVTAADAKASLELIIANKGTLANLFAGVASINAPDATTLEIVTSRPMPDLIPNLTRIYVGPGDRIADEAFWEAPVGSGPFQFESYNQGDRVVLTGNEDYWGGAPKLERLELIQMLEAAPKVTALEAGDIDVLWNIPVDLTGRLKTNPEVVYDSIPSYNYYFMWFNNGREPFTDPLVRQALAEAVDVDSIVTNVLGDLGTPAVSAIPATVPGAGENKDIPYDPENAKKLLAEAGFPDGFSTTMEMNPGMGMNIDLIARAMISDWAKVGITVELLEKEAAVFNEDFRNNNYDLHIQPNQVITGDAAYATDRLYNCERVAASINHCYEELDKLIKDARVEMDPAERSAIFEEANQFLWENYVGIYQADVKYDYAVRSNVQGFVMPPSATPRFDQTYIG